ncbi:MAG TPA: hypothetical protein VM406_08580 [Noviherbaspirillum sp.]|nr:hypothetical protein [Noviherbaspirillum sp.]
MSATTASNFLRKVLLADGVGAAAGAVALVALSAPLSALLGLPQLLLTIAGVLLGLIAAGVLWLASRERMPRAGVWAVIAVNVVWVLDSLLLLVSGYVNPTAFGQAFIVAQAAVVAVFAELEYIGLRRPQAVTA